jgi:hypothetical protein
MKDLRPRNSLLLGYGDLILFMYIVILKKVNLGLQLLVKGRSSHIINYPVAEMCMAVTMLGCKKRLL